MGVCNSEYPYFTMKPKQLQRCSEFHAMFVKDFGLSARQQARKSQDIRYSKIDLLPAKSALLSTIKFHCFITAGQVFPVIKRLQNFLFWSIIYCGPIHYSFIEYLVKWLVYSHKNHNFGTSINDIFWPFLTYLPFPTI